MIVKVLKDGTIPLKAFRDIVDIKKVHSYTLEEKGDVLVLQFYGKNGKKLKVKDGKRQMMIHAAPHGGP